MITINPSVSRARADSRQEVRYLFSKPSAVLSRTQLLLLLLLFLIIIFLTLIIP
jgi:hypothetical protein